MKIRIKDDNGFVPEIWLNPKAIEAIEPYLERYAKVYVRFKKEPYICYTNSWEPVKYLYELLEDSLKGLVAQSG